MDTFQSSASLPLGIESTFDQIMAASHTRLAQLFSKIGPVEQCAILKHRAAMSWQFLLPDIDVAGRWRAQLFVCKGFAGHTVYPSLIAALEDVIQNGYCIRDDQALDRLQNSPEFIRGNFVADLLRQVNSQQITISEANYRLASYDAAHGSNAMTKGE